MTEFVVALALLVTGCTGAIGGTPLFGPEFPAGERTVVARVSTADADGFRVLYKGRTSGGDFDQSGWIAGTGSQLARLWENVGIRTSPPDVDFTRYVVVGLVGGGAVCISEVTAATIDVHGVVELDYDKPTTCPVTGQCTCQDALTRVAEVVAIPRRWLGKQLEFVSARAAFRFDVPEPEHSPTVTQPAKLVTPGDFARAELVELPPKGHLALRTLRNNLQVWVTHDRDGSVSVFSANYQQKNEPYLGSPLRWSELGRFTDGYDAHGRCVYGVAPDLGRVESPQGYASKRHDESHVLVGAPVTIPPGPIQPRDEAPILDGPDRAYTQLQPLPGWDALADGNVGLVDLDIVMAPSSGVRLCKAPLPKEPHADYSGCPRSAPFIGEYSRGKPDGHIVAFYGPFVVHRQGSTAKILAKPP
jgi:hypothetical protein